MSDPFGADSFEDEVAQLRAEVGRLRADLADARQRIGEATLRLTAWASLAEPAWADSFRELRAALSAGGGGPTEGDGDE